MTVQAVDPSSRYTASPGATDFVYAFKIRRGSDLLVRVNGVAKTLGVDYSVSGVTAPTGSVTFFVAMAGGELVQLDRNMPYDRTTDYQNLGDLRAPTLNNDQDDPVMMIQQLKWQQEFYAKFPDSLTPGTFDPVFPTPELNNLIGWNDTLSGFKNVDPADLATAIAYGNKNVQTFIGPAQGVDGVNADFILSQNPGSLGNLDVSIDGVTQVNGIDFTYNGLLLKFASPPPLNAVILVRFDQAVPVGTGLATAIQFLQAGAGAVLRDSQSKMRERYSLHDVLTTAEIADSQTGAPVIDLAAKIQLALANNRGKLYIPAGSYLSSPVTSTTSVVIEGDGSAVDAGFRATRIFTPGTGTDWLVVDSHNPSTIRDLAILCAVPGVAGSGITLTCTTPFLGTVNKFSLIENCRFESCFVGVNALRASSWTARGCTFWNIPPNGFGCLVNNTFNEDQGDQSIEGNTFNGHITAIGVAWTGGGGTRIINNKSFMAQFLYADLTQTVGGETAQFILSNNSIDVPVSPGGAGVHPVSFQMIGGVTHFENIIVSDNLFIGYFAMAEMLAFRGNATAKIRNVTVNGNILTNPTGSFTGSGMLLLENTQDFTVSGNTIIGPGSSNGINIDATCSNGTVHGNHVRGFTNNILNNSSSVAVRRRTDSGSTGSVADGGVITHKLGVAPTKIIISGTTAAQTYTPFSPTSTQFQVSVRNTAGASGTASTIHWEVEE